MFPRKHRVTKTVFQDVLTTGKLAHGEFVYSRYLPESRIFDGTVRFSTVIPRKVARKAHDRNRLKRLFNVAVFARMDEFPLGHYIFFAKPSLRDAGREDVEADVARLLDEFKKAL